MNLGEIVSGVLKPISDYFNKRQEIKAIEHQNKLELLKAEGERKAQLIRDGLAADMAWETEFAKQAANSWKDEYTLIVVSVPVVMAFIPGLDIYVQKGFTAFAACPLWYQVMVQTLFYATYGIRLWRRQISDT
jgi:hypothetical protein